MLRTPSSKGRPDGKKRISLGVFRTFGDTALVEGIEMAFFASPLEKV
jgi:hypothetical protein